MSHSRRKNVQTHNSTDVFFCALNAYVSILPAFIPVVPAKLRVGSRGKKRGRHFPEWVAGICLSIANAFSPCFYVCLCQTDSRKCSSERIRSGPEGSPQREARSPSSSVDICDCRRTDKMPSGQRCVLRQTEI